LIIAVVDRPEQGGLLPGQLHVDLHDLPRGIPEVRLQGLDVSIDAAGAGRIMSPPFVSWAADPDEKSRIVQATSITTRG
jgi:hypothetical protein